MAVTPQTTTLQLNNSQTYRHHTTIALQRDERQTCTAGTRHDASAVEERQHQHDAIFETRQQHKTATRGSPDTTPSRSTHNTKPRGQRVATPHICNTTFGKRAQKSCSCHACATRTAPWVSPAINAAGAAVRQDQRETPSSHPRSKKTVPTSAAPPCNQPPCA